MSVNVQPRDITLSFKDSCSCACCITPKEPELYYVNKNGELEAFSKSKSKGKEKEAFDRAMSHLVETLNNRIKLVDGDTREFMEKFTEIVSSMNYSSQITKTNLDNINALILEHFKEKGSN